MPRALLAVALACLAIAAPAAASPVLVYDNGHVTKADDPALPPASADPLPAAAHECGPGTEGARPLATAAAVSVPTAPRRGGGRGPDPPPAEFGGWGGS